MSDKIADVGKAENNPVSAWSVIELQREVSKLGAENARLKETIAAQQRQIKRMGEQSSPLWDAPISPPRQQEQESVPVRVHPPCRVTHSGGE